MMKSVTVFIVALFLYPGLFAQRQQEFLQDDFSQRPLSQEQIAQQQFASQQRSLQRQSFLQQSTTPAPVAMIIKQINSHNEDGSYTFGYESQDGSYRVETKGNDGLTRGKYGYIDAAGVLREVEYSAGGQFGYEPSGSHIQVPPRAPPKKPGEIEDEYDDDGNPIRALGGQRFQSFADSSPPFSGDTSQFIQQPQVRAPVRAPVRAQPVRTVAAAPQQQFSAPPQQQFTAPSQRQLQQQQLQQQQQFIEAQPIVHQPLSRTRDFTFANAQSQIQQQPQPLPLAPAADFNFQTQAQAQPLSLPRQRQPQVEVRLVEEAPPVAPLAAAPAVSAPTFQIQSQPQTFQRQQHSPLNDFFSKLQNPQRQF